MKRLRTVLTALSHDYGRLVRWRTTDPAERARALGADRPPEQAPGQQDLFSEQTNRQPALSDT